MIIVAAILICLTLAAIHWNEARLDECDRHLMNQIQALGTTLVSDKQTYLGIIKDFETHCERLKSENDALRARSGVSSTEPAN